MFWYDVPHIRRRKINFQDWMETFIERIVLSRYDEQGIYWENVHVADFRGEVSVARRELKRLTQQMNPASVQEKDDTYTEYRRYTTPMLFQINYGHTPRSELKKKTCFIWDYLSPGQIFDNKVSDNTLKPISILGTRHLSSVSKEESDYGI